MEGQEDHLEHLPHGWEELSDERSAKCVMISLPKIQTRCFIEVDRDCLKSRSQSIEEGVFTMRHAVTGEVIKSGLARVEDRSLRIKARQGELKSRVEFYLGGLEFDLEDLHKIDDEEIELRAEFPVRGYLCISGAPFAEAVLEIEEGKIKIRVKKPLIGVLSETLID